MEYLQYALEPLGPWLIDAEMIEVSVNPDGKVWLIKRGDVTMSFAGLTLDQGVAERLTNLIAGNTHTKTGQNNLLVSATIQYRDRPIRAQSVLPPAAFGGAALSFRMFSTIPINQIELAYLYAKSCPTSQRRAEKLATLRQLIEGADLIDTLRFCVEKRLNILVSGGTETGKTVVLRKLVSFIPYDSRLITIEDAPELFPGHPNHVSLVADRSGDVRSADKLLEASLRMRPDRLIVGEVRGREAMTFLEAINTGQEGGFATIHCETPELARDRLAIAASRSGIPMTYDNFLTYIDRTIDVIIQTGRDGAMRGISEIYLPEKETVA
ncbi:ATPase, T2SS/T4P/T4SS family [Ochrobactrum sp. BTU1]|uniref:ATPase, T2SS/T4P/T4SS family n=1 Tax=Ochrobactrum sp. BTU1 TaxID=2840456 RepID=UPI001C04EDAE|nr:Flp pilus assembly complex ATPase component TadA [Ochrobactrum sp. BTU1]